jgi:cyclophilin family peptidyl-prolyl cis-trans isomerase/HEAT repeat protein
MNERRVSWFFALGLAALAGCSKGAPKSGAASSASAHSSAPATPAAQRGRELFKAEARRDSAAVSSNDLSSRDPSLRRTAARTLARIADARSAELLAKSLADEDREVVTWSAYGLGYACRNREPAVVRALALRAASWPEPVAAEKRGPAGALISPIEAIADALGRCGTPDAERTLRAWLDGPRVRAEAAALALGRLAATQGRLEDTSLVALLDAASRPEAPLPQALYAFTRLPGLGEPVRARLFSIAKTTLEAPASTFAIRALGQGGPASAAPLRAALENDKLPANVRADAARELGRQREPGQVALRAALPLLAQKLLDDQTLRRAEYGVLARTLESLEPPLREAREVLEKIAVLPLASGDAPELRRRKVALRCRAAGLLAGRATLSQRLRECDPDANGRTGALAVVEVLDRGELKGARLQRFRELASGGDVVVREAALELLGGHPEAERAFELLAAALAEKVPGLVISAAKVLATYPDRSEEAAPPRKKEQASDLARPATVKPHAKVISALMAAFEASQSSPNIELLAALMDAAAALQLLGVKPALERHCKSSNATLRARAEAALRVLGDRERRCTEFGPSDAAFDSSALIFGPTRVKLRTEIGELTLNLSPELAPIATTRFIELARAGFYDGMLVHRVVPGFVVQFGDPQGDGYGGSGKPPLPCETSPVSFAPGSIGVALAGRDTGDSQLFVTLGDYPHLDGEYALLGRAEGPWDRLIEGDRIQTAKVEP